MHALAWINEFLYGPIAHVPYLPSFQPCGATSSVPAAVPRMLCLCMPHLLAQKCSFIERKLAGGGDAGGTG